MPMTENKIRKNLLDYYRTKFPSMKHPQIEHLRRITDGWETEVFSFKLIHEETSDLQYTELILRIYPGGSADQKASNEFNAMRKLHEMDYPVPKVFLLERETTLFGHPFLIMEKISGSPMGSLTPLAHQKQFCKLLSDLHSLNWKRFRHRLSVYGSRDPKRLVTLYKEFIETLKRPNFLPIVAWLEKQSARLGTPKLAPTHQDFHPNNILLKQETNTAYVIDWTSFDISDFRVDLAWTLLLTSTYGSPQARNVIFKDYEDISGHSVENIEFFDVIACLRRLLDISVSLSNGASSMGMRPGAEELIKQKKNHITNVYELFQERTELDIPEIASLLTRLEEEN